MISPDGHRVFGIIAEQSSSETSGSTGSWELTLVAPCLTDASDPTSANSDCTAVSDMQRMHDFMSYGPWLPWTSDLLGPKVFRWASDITYSRIYGKLRTGTLRPPTGTLAEAPPIRPAQANTGLVEALIVSGVVRESGSVELLEPLLSKFLPSSQITSGQGPYSLELIDNSDQIILQELFDVDQIGHSNRDGLFWLAIPDVGGAQTLRIKKGSSILLERRASQNTPNVRIISPNGGEIITSDEMTVRWEASDQDGDMLTFMVQYSPDGGESWQGIALVDDPTFEATARLQGLFPGQQALIRVTASDGFNNSYDLSDGFFSLGTGDTPESAGPSLSVSPAGGLRSTDIELNGSGYVPGGYEGTILWDGSPVGTLPVPEGGTFTVPFTIPADASPGIHTITVCAGTEATGGAAPSGCFAGEFEQKASTNFEVIASSTGNLPDLTVSVDGPVSFLPGDEIETRLEFAVSNTSNRELIRKHGLYGRSGPLYR